MRTLATLGDRQAIEVRIAALTPSDRALWGKMSVDQMICHLRDAYLLALGQKAASPASGFLQRTLVKWIALRSPLQWPKGVPTRPEMEQGVGGTPPTIFEEDRKKLLAVLDLFRDETIDDAIAHPIFGVLATDEWLRWGYLHADHHLRQFGR